MKKSFSKYLFVFFTLAENILLAVSLSEYLFVILMPSRVPKLYVDLVHNISEIIGLTIFAAWITGFCSVCSFLCINGIDFGLLSALRRWLYITIILNILLTIAISLTGRANL